MKSRRRIVHQLIGTAATYSIFLATLHFGCATGAMAQNVATLVHQSVEKCNKDDYHGAMALLNKALILDPNVDVIWSNRGLCKYRLHDYLGAIEDYTRAISLNKSESEHWRMRGVIKMRKSAPDFQGAVADFSKAIELNPGGAAAWNNRALAKDELKDVTGAIADIVQAQRLAPSDENLPCDEGRIRRDDLKASEECYLRSIKIKPNCPAYDWLGNLQFEQGRWAEAKANLESAVRLDPAVPTAYMILGQIAEIQENVGEAERNYQRVFETQNMQMKGGFSLKIDADNHYLTSTYLLWADMLRRKGRFGDANEVISRAKKTPAVYNVQASDFQRIASLIDRRITLGKLNEYPSEEAIAKAGLTGSNSSSSSSSSSPIATSSSTALSLLTPSKKFKLKPYVPSLPPNATGSAAASPPLTGTAAEAASANAKGLKKALARDFQGALADFTQAIELDSTNIQYLINRSRCKADNQDLVGAMEDCNEAVKLDPLRDVVWSDRGVLKSRLTDQEGAIKDLRQAVKLAPTKGSNYQRLGVCLKADGQMKAAYTAFQKAVELDPKNFAAWCSLGTTQYKLHKIADAEQSYRKSISINPFFHPALCNLGDALRMQGKFEEAKLWLLRAKNHPEGAKHQKLIDDLIKLNEQRSTTEIEGDGH